MSDLIRMMHMEMSHNGTCRKCGQPRDKGDHSRCDSIRGGFIYRANSEETTLLELKAMVALICKGDSDDTPIQFKLQVKQCREPLTSTAPKPNGSLDEDDHDNRED
jgi:hypothetical protein